MRYKLQDDRGEIYSSNNKEDVFVILEDIILKNLGVETYGKLEIVEVLITQLPTDLVDMPTNLITKSEVRTIMDSKWYNVNGRLMVSKSDAGLLRMLGISPKNLLPYNTTIVDDDKKRYSAIYGFYVVDE